MARRQRFQPAPRLTHEFNVATGLNITPQTLRNRLHDSNLRAYRPAVRPRLLPRHRQARLEFARQNVNWDNQRWEPVLFTDESRFCLDFHDGRRRVWREARQRYSQALVERMGWPAVSPDLNPIQHVWDQLQHRLSQRPNQPQTLDELENALREEWNNLPQQNMVNLIMSMQRRCQAVLRARGGHTEY